MPDNEKLITLDNLSTFKDNVEEVIDAKIQESSSMIADAYDPASTYALGDVVVYDNKLYQCISAISTAEAWTPAHWQQVAVDVNNIVTITATGVQSDATAAKILNAKALYYDKLIYVRKSENLSEVKFSRYIINENYESEYILSLNKSTKNVSVESTPLYSRVKSIGGKYYGAVSIDSSLQTTGGSTSGTLGLTGKLPYLTTAPTANNTSGFLTIVVLSSEPATRYDGYLYIITGSAN